MARSKGMAEQKNHTGVGWFILGLVIAAVYLFFIVMGTHQDADTHTPIWTGVIVGVVMAIFGLVGMTKRRHPGHL